MSFTNDLKTEGTRARTFFEEHFPNVAAARAELRLQVAGAETLEPEETDGYPWGTVGVTIDYRLRFCFPAAASLPSRWETWSANPGMPFALLVGDPNLPKALVAEWGASESAGEGSPWTRAAGAFFSELGLFLRQTRPHERRLDAEAEDRLCRFCFVLGLYDELERSRGAWSGTPLLGLGPEATTDDLLGLCSAAAAADMAAMVDAFHGSQAELLKGGAVLNPGFAYRGGGADGDLVVEGCYIDIKAARDPKRPSPPQWPWELLGYTLLDHEDRYGISSVGLYLPRQSLLVTWPLEDFSRMLAGEGVAQLPIDVARRELRRWLAA
jgi:hypothetical protein